jgi:hypothetical protein
MSPTTDIRQHRTRTADKSSLNTDRVIRRPPRSTAATCRSLVLAGTSRPTSETFRIPVQFAEFLKANRRLDAVAEGCLPAIDCLGTVLQVLEPVAVAVHLPNQRIPHSKPISDRKREGVFRQP